MLPLAFKLFTCTGCWRPNSWSSRGKKIIYNIYSSFVIFLMFGLTISQVIDMTTIKDTEDFTENSYMAIMMICACSKMTNILIRRKNVIGLIKHFQEKPCIPLNNEEIEIQTKYDKLIHKNSLQYTIMIETSVTSSVLTSLLVDLKSKTLPFRAWLPYDCSSGIVFYLTYVYQLTSMISASLIIICTDIMFCGFLLQICCQIDILVLRLNGIKANQDKLLRYCMHHHNRIYELAKAVNDTFAVWIIAQYVASTLVLCVSLIQLLKKDMLSMDFLALILYLSTLLLEIFLHCWYANEVKLKSIQIADTIFQIDWTELRNETKKFLLFGMQRAGSPIEFKGARLITLDLESFVLRDKKSSSLRYLIRTRTRRSVTLRETFPPAVESPSEGEKKFSTKRRAENKRRDPTPVELSVAVHFWAPHLQLCSAGTFVLLLPLRHHARGFSFSEEPQRSTRLAPLCSLGLASSIVS